MRSRIYSGKVMHLRHAPVRHGWEFPFCFYAIDLGELPELDRTVRGFGHNRWRPVCLRDRDYLRGNGTLRQQLSEFVDLKETDRIVLVTVARFMARVFNPVSFYYCLKGDGSPAGVVAEVNNTFGERHLYRMDAAASNWPFECRHCKEFHVSPFNNREGHYEFTFSEPGENMRIAIRLVRDGATILDAAVWGTGRPLTTANLWKTVLRHPFTAALTTPRIIWQAAILFYKKKLPVFAKPNPENSMTIKTKSASRFEQKCFRLIDGHLQNIACGHLVLELPDGTEKHYGQPQEQPQRIRVNRHRFFTRLALGGNIGLGEAWTDADWDSPDPTGVLTCFIRNIAALKRSGLAASAAMRLLHLLQHARNRNTRAGSRRNIQAHYDLGNDFYRLFLDEETMLYSAAVFAAPGEPLADAQRRKIHRLIDLAGIRPEHHVLEIGCGWGGFAIETARQTGCRVTGITISEEQFRFARERVAAAGLEDRVEIVLCDYRAMPGCFDRIVSIEMLEAVGHAYYGTFFAACDRLLKPGGRVVLQVITIPDQRYDAYRRSPDWIQKHIFPGGMLPSLTELSKAMTRHSAFTVERLENIGLHYPETLRRWRQAFEQNREKLSDMGYDTAFQRKWLFYLCYCEAGFQTRFTSNLHLVLARPAEDLG